MEMTKERLGDKESSIERVEALKTLTRLLLQEVESFAEIFHLQKNRNGEKAVKLTEKLQRYEMNLICHALLEAKGNQRKAAQILGTKATTLHAKIRRYEIDLFSVFGHFVD